MLPSLLGQKAIDGVYWTLKIELFFYLFVLLLLIIKQQQKIIWISIVYLLLGILNYFKIRRFKYDLLLWNSVY